MDDDMTLVKPPLIVIAGPTASGKSALAIEAAKRVGGEVINADSAQVYRDLRILSAIPSEEEKQGIAHHLFGTRDGAKPCSAADWAAAAKDAIADTRDRGHIPILCGGTGLYIRTLLDGIAPIPEIDSQIRKDVRAAAVTDNYAELSVLDPVGANRLNPGDTSRVARALEVVLSSGKPISYWQERCEGGIGDQVDLKPIILLPPRDWLNERIERRFDLMMVGGAMREVEALSARDLDPDLPVMRAIGVGELIDVLDGEADEDHGRAAAIHATRRYAKRQFTWLAHQPPADWPRFAEPLDSEPRLAAALALLAPSA